MKRSWAFMAIEPKLWIQGTESFLEIAALSLSNELVVEGFKRPFVYSCYPMKVNGWEGYELIVETIDDSN